MKIRTRSKRAWAIVDLGWHGSGPKICGYSDSITSATKRATAMNRRAKRPSFLVCNIKDGSVEVTVTESGIAYTPSP